MGAPTRASPTIRLTGINSNDSPRPLDFIPILSCRAALTLHHRLPG